MADEVFALSPIAARPVMPGDADYDAIRDAFMETSRGRWFLAEYAKRNRNADTAMVLDAVARIEQNVAAQKQGAQALIESLTAIHAIIGEAKANVARAIAGLEDEAVFTAAIGGARNIREVAATLRECGADARICDLLDSQIAAIDAGHRVVAGIDIDDILGSFDRMVDRLGDLAGVDLTEPDAAQPQAARSASAPAASAVDEPPPVAETQAASTDAPRQSAAAGETTHRPETVVDRGLIIVDGHVADELEFVEAATAPADPTQDESAAVASAAVIQQSEPAFEAAAAEPAMAEAPIAEAPFAEAPFAEAPVAEAERLLDEVVALDAEMAEDDAILDLIAREMAAPELQDEIEANLHPADVETPAFEPAAEAISQQDVVQAVFSPAIASPEPVVMSAPPPAMADAPAAPASIGAAVLASGIVAPAPSSNAALTPFRRMSQAEKIAFFS